MQKHIRISWDDEAQTILRRDADYGWTWTELDAANAEMAEILDAVEHDVCTLVVQNYSESYMPSNALTRISTMLPGKHPRVLLSVVVSRSAVVRSIIKLITMIYPRASHLRYAENIEEARQQIKEFLAQQHS
jgi:hypothetical protein